VRPAPADQRHVPVVPAAVSLVHVPAPRQREQPGHRIAVAHHAVVAVLADPSARPRVVVVAMSKSLSRPK
jgi:hypothetical protein